MPKKKATKAKETKQLHVVKVCPRMSRRVTFLECGLEHTKFIRQGCLGPDCELWDPVTEHCSSRTHGVDADGKRLD